jgi:hypothetical protein
MIKKYSAPFSKTQEFVEANTVFAPDEIFGLAAAESGLYKPRKK